MDNGDLEKKKTYLKKTSELVLIQSIQKRGKRELQLISDNGQVELFKLNLVIFFF